MVTKTVKTTTLLILLALLLSGLLLAGLWLARSRAPQAAAPTIQPPGAAIGPGNAPQAWNEPPPCAQQPWSLAEWRNAGPAGALRAQQAAALDSGTAGSNDARQALLLNLAGGRLNRATEITLPDSPNIQTIGDLLAQTGDLQADQAVLSGAAITRAVCAQLVIMQSGSQVQGVQWAMDGMRAATAAGLPALAGPPDPSPRVRLDSGSASPDGQWAAFTSLGADSGGPIYLYHLRSAQWTNLIAALNAARPPDSPPLAEADWWTVIDWFPDSTRLLIGRSDASSVLVVDLPTFTFQTFTFPGEGNGGGFAVDLAPDGSRFAYLGFAPDGSQTLNIFTFADQSSATTLSQSFAEGVLLFPRFSPDGAQIAYLNQTGDPLQEGVSYAMHLLALADGATRKLVPGNLGLTVPVWSPDGRWIAFTRDSVGQPYRVSPGQAPMLPDSQVWAAAASGEALIQVTSGIGAVRSPLWASDARTLAFITQDGQVGLASLDAPGRAWRAAQAGSGDPLLTSVFFVP